MSSVLLTGASGFIGRNFIDWLQRFGHHPIAWVRRPAAAQELRDQGVDAVVGELSDYKTLNSLSGKISAVFHLAGTVSPYNRHATFEINVEQTRRLAEQLANWSNPPVFIYVSSLAAAGPSLDGLARLETDPCQPRSIYGESKAAAEAALQTLADRLPISIVRPPGVIGPWDRNLLQMFQMVRTGFHTVGISQKFRYSFVHVEDLSTGLWKTFTEGRRILPTNERSQELKQGIYFIADPDQYTMPDVANLIADATDTKHPRHLTVPTPICWTLATVADAGGRWLGMRTFLNRDKMREAVAGSWICDVTRAREQLGFVVGATFAQRIRETADWYREKGWIKKSARRS